jgi:signal transduction histidine kinase
MIQFIDISTSILYDREKAENKLLSLINAFISHELRNPLNSIVAQNIEQRFLCQQLQEMIRQQLSKEKNKTFLHEVEEIL